MTKKLLLLFCLCGLFFTACKDNDDSKKEDVVLTGEISLSMDFKKIASGEFTVDVTAEGSWTATSDKSWVKVSPEKGTGDATVTVTVAHYRREVGRAHFAVIHRRNTTFL